MSCSASLPHVVIEGVGERGLEPPAPLFDERYRLGESLGQGGMGIVHAAHDLLLDRQVAIKLVDPSRASSDALEAFEKEARALAQIRHRNVVLIYAFGVCASSYYIVMEYVRGRNLASIIEEAVARGSTVAPDRALEIVRHVGRGLQAVHDRKLVHRDVKPGNIVIEAKTGRPVLIDFGLARRRTRSSPRLSGVAGTPAYMAPEVATDRSGTKTTPRADIYALACTTFELLSGRSVFEDRDPLAVLRAHVDEAPPVLSSFVPDLAPLDAVLQRAMAKAPADRYATCDAFLHALDAAADALRPRESGVIRRGAANAERVRVILAQRDGEERRAIARVVERTLRAAGDGVEIESVESGAELLASFARDPADVAIIDDDSVPASRVDLIEPLRRASGGSRAELLLLVEEESCARDLEELRARQLPKPLNMNALAIVIGTIGRLTAQRRRLRPAK
ncbi:MAG: serine/threonine protein kinase [Labilithrix sp.]|nr:serine/threonine protein kinase [Labilithrix sp.]